MHFRTAEFVLAQINGSNSNATSNAVGFEILRTKEHDMGLLPRICCGATQ
jgi:hypothetical protein